MRMKSYSKEDGRGPWISGKEAGLFSEAVRAEFGKIILIEMFKIDYGVGSG